MKKAALTILTILIVAICILVILYGKKQGIIVARYVTNEHYRYSPVELNSDIYFPSSYDLKDYKELKSIGHLGARDKSFINDILLDVGEVLVEDGENPMHFTVMDDSSMSYSKVNYLQQANFIKDNMDKYDSFALCSDKDKSETRIIIEKDVIAKLQATFGVIEYNKEDFNNCDDIYYIYVNSPKEKIHERTFDDPIIYLGCIFAKDNKLYYGNLTNEIKDDLQNQLKVYIQ